MRLTRQPCLYQYDPSAESACHPDGNSKDQLEHRLTSSGRPRHRQHLLLPRSHPYPAPKEINRSMCMPGSSKSALSYRISEYGPANTASKGPSAPCLAPEYLHIDIHSLCVERDVDRSILGKPQAGLQNLRPPSGSGSRRAAPRDLRRILLSDSDQTLRRADRN